MMMADQPANPIDRIRSKPELLHHFMCNRRAFQFLIGACAASVFGFAGFDSDIVNKGSRFQHKTQRVIAVFEQRNGA